MERMIGLSRIHTITCNLKRTRRTGWNILGRRVPYPESVAAHVLGVVRIAMELPQEYLDEVDVDRYGLVEMLAMHDDTEHVPPGDVVAQRIKDPDKRAAFTRKKHAWELYVLAEERANIGGERGDRYWDLGVEYMEKKTPRAKLAKQIDMFELMRTAVHVYRWGRQSRRARVIADPRDFWPEVNAVVTAWPLRQILDAEVLPIIESLS